MKILLTGERGEIGSLFYRILKKKHKVFLISGISKIKEIDLFIHLGATGPKKPFNKIVNSNIIRLRELLNIIKNIKIKQIIFFSSCSVYGEYQKKIITENDIYKKQNIYGLSKIYGEKFFLNKFDQGVTCVRLPAILTNNNYNHYIGSLIKKLMQNKNIILNDIKSKFNFFIDPINLLEFILDKKKLKKNHVINLCADSTHSLYYIVNYMKKKLNSSSSIIYKKDISKKIFLLSNKKAKKLYGFKPYNVKASLDNWIKEIGYEKN